MKVHKKRGRKPKGGKIIAVPSKAVSDYIPELQNIILHLKVSTSKLPTKSAYVYESINSNREYKEIEVQKNPNISIQDKLKDLKLKLHNNNIISQSAFFLCT